jgi:dTDP-glucose pyrophosphorylase
MTEETAIVYMVAGISSRFGGKIKQFAPVGPNGETLIEYSLKQALKAGFTKIIFIVGNLTEAPFKKMFGNNFQGIPIAYVLQKFHSDRDKPWGTCDAACSAASLLDCPFVICNGDDIYGEETFRILFNHLKTSSEAATIGYKLINVLPEKGAVNRGMFRIDNNYVRKITETFNISQENFKSLNLSKDDLCSQNVFALHPETIQ